MVAGMNIVPADANIVNVGSDMTQLHLLLNHLDIFVCSCPKFLTIGASTPAPSITVPRSKLLRQPLQYISASGSRSKACIHANSPANYA